MNQDDAELIARLFAGDKLAWEEFVDLYSKPILAAIKNALRKHRVSTRQGYKTGLQDDIFHDIFVTLIESNFVALRSFKGKNGCRLASYLRIYAGHRAVDYLNNVKLISLDVATTKKSSGCNERDQKRRLEEALSSDPDVPILKNHEIGLEELLEKLDEEERCFVQIAYLSGLSSKDGAKSLGLSVGAYDMRKKRIKETLKEIAKDVKQEDC